MKILNDYTGTLPYASELFGIYQPLLGWKSQIIAQRFEKSRARAYTAIATKALNQLHTAVEVRASSEGRDVFSRSGRARFAISNLKPADLDARARPVVSAAIDSGIAHLLQENLGDQPPADWKERVDAEQMAKLLDKLQEILLKPEELARHPGVQSYAETFLAALGRQDSSTMLRALFDKETRVAGYLVFLAQHAPAQLTPLFYQLPKNNLVQMATFADPLLNFGANAYRAVLSPVGIIHLYREYFFEFDSFLGPPVGHVWLSPGGAIELIEVNTRKVFTERTYEESTEIIQKAETETTSQDDIADAVKEENRNNMKFGFTNMAQYTAPVFQDTATASFSIDNAQTRSREATHKQMRRQSEKLSSEIKRNFKTTFRTSTEVTDTTSKRYVIRNTTQRLLNYELRRKMRKVGVQVQDIGVQMCWHTFVDDPGRELGIAKLVHLGDPPEMSGVVVPEAPSAPVSELQELNLSIPFEGIDTDDNDMAYTDGSETEVGAVFDETEHIRADFPQSATFSKPNYTLKSVSLEAVGMDARVSARNPVSAEGSSKGTFDVHLDYVNWGGRDQFTVKATLAWEPSPDAVEKIKTAYNAAMTKFNAESARRYKEAYIKASRERIKLASKVTPRPVDELREEERTVVYRRLISQLMSVAPKESKHVVSELVRSLFDIDKMLYFVAPEWWVPRLHRSTQQLGAEVKPPETAAAAAASTKVTGHFGSAIIDLRSVLKPSEVQAHLGAGQAAPQPASIPAANIVDWGGAKEFGRDNYYITEDSAPAKLGSSLGWLLQLDGDNLRNALLNAPWVKAVIPIRIGKEQEAINWLRQAHVEGNDGLDAEYVADPGDPPELKSTPERSVTILDALTILSQKIQEFDQKARTPILPNPAAPDDPRNHFAGSLPTEAVFESGFYPLKGSIRFDQPGTDQAIFSQWMEIMPTDQIAALEVEYDAKTLQIKVVPQPKREPDGTVDEPVAPDPDDDGDPP